MRVALIAQGPENVGSTYWRALQHIPRLQQRGVDVDLFLPQNVPRRWLHRVGQVVYFGEHAARYVALGSKLRSRLGSYDAVLAQRGGYPMGSAWIVRSLERFSGRVVLDLDDNVFAVSPRLATKSRAARWVYGDQQTRYLLDRADVVVVSTTELDQCLPGRRADLILPTVPDVAGYPTVEHRVDPPIQAGWVGNAGNLIYLDPLRDVFERLRREKLVELEVLCSEPWSGPATYRPWRRSDEVAALARYDVGIMPLPDTEYTRAKAGFKLLLYMGVGSAVIASPVGINEELVRSSGAGILSGSPAQWEAALRELANDRTLRVEMGRAGQGFIASYADMEAQADALVGALRGDVRPVSRGRGLGC